MNITVKWFAGLRDITGVETCALTLPQSARVSDARQALLAQYPQIQPWLPYARPAVNLVYQPWETPLADGDELALILPVSGG